MFTNSLTEGRRRDGMARVGRQKTKKTTLDPRSGPGIQCRCLWSLPVSVGGMRCRHLRAPLRAWLRPGPASPSATGLISRNIGVAQPSQELHQHFPYRAGQSVNLVQQRFVRGGEGRRLRCRRYHRGLSHAGKRLAGGQPLRVSPQQLGEREKVSQANIFGQAVFPLIDRRRREAQRLGDVRLGQARLFPGGSNSVGQ